jgi:hypothetical protein
MSEALVAITEIRPEQSRTVLMGMNGLPVGAPEVHPSRPNDYESAIDDIVDLWQSGADSWGRPLVAGTVVLPASVGEHGEVAQASELPSWRDNQPGADLGNMTGFRVEVLPTVRAVARSQAHINRENGRSVQGVAALLDRSWASAVYLENGTVADEEPGHDYWRPGDTCPCTGEEHDGTVMSDHEGDAVSDWLQASPERASNLVTDIATSVISALESDAHGFMPEEWRWAGSMAVNQPHVLRQASEQVRGRFGRLAPVFETVSMGDQAAIHGAFLQARDLALYP